MKKTTIVDIAKSCGVSMKTVSRVINNSPKVREETREKVYLAIKEQGYQINILAKGLKENRTNIIVVFADRHKEEHLSIWHSIMLKYLFSYAKECSMKMILSPSNSERFEKDETDGFYLIASGIADGAILLENTLNDPRVDYFEKHHVPFVVFGEAENPQIPSVSLDNFDIGYKGAVYLTEKGYDRIALFIGEERFRSTQLRILGFETAMKEKKAEYYIFTGIDTIEKAYRKSVQVLKECNIRVFFVSGDERAIGVYRGIYEHGYRIPEDIAVLGIDNIPLGEFLCPPISTVEQDFKTLARCCMDFVVSEITEGRQEGRQKVFKFPSRIMERQST